MKKLIRRSTMIFLIAALLMVPLTASTAQMSSPNKVTAPSIGADAVVCRPLGIAATAVGTTVFIVSLPFSALGGNIGEVGRILVVEPAKFTFCRPIGKFHPNQ